MKTLRPRFIEVRGFACIIMILALLAFSTTGWSKPLWTTLDSDNRKNPVNITNETFSKLAEKLKPAVANIRTTVVVKQHPFFRGGPSPFGEQDPFRDFWEKFFGGEIPGNSIPNPSALASSSTRKATL